MMAFSTGASHAMSISSSSTAWIRSAAGQCSHKDGCANLLQLSPEHRHLSSREPGLVFASKRSRRSCGVGIPARRSSHREWKCVAGSVSETINASSGRRSNRPGHSAGSPIRIHSGERWTNAGIETPFRWSFGDHHRYHPPELRRLAVRTRRRGAEVLLTTEKDVPNLPLEHTGTRRANADLRS